MAVKAGKNDVLSFFPSGSIKSSYVSMHSVRDYKQYKNEKTAGSGKQEVVGKHGRVVLDHMETTPLHLACHHSNPDAVRILIT